MSDINKVKFKTGTLSDMPSDLEAGTIALARDTGDMYICVPDLDNPTSNTKYKHHINPQTNYNQTDQTKLDYLVGREDIVQGIDNATQKAETALEGVTEAIGKAESAQNAVYGKLDSQNSLGSGYIAYNKSSEVPAGTNSVTFGTSCAAAGDSSAAIGYNCKTSADKSFVIGDHGVINSSNILFAIGDNKESPDGIELKKNILYVEKATSTNDGGVYIRESNPNPTSSEDALVFNKVLTTGSGITKNSDALVNSLVVGYAANVGTIKNETLAVGQANILSAEGSAAIGNYNVVQRSYALAVGDKAVISSDSGIIFAVGTNRADSGNTDNNGFYVKYDGHECSAFVQKEDSSGNVVIKELGGDIEWDNF